MHSDAGTDRGPDPDSDPVDGHDSRCRAGLVKPPDSLGTPDGALMPAFSCPVVFHGIYNASDGTDVLYVLTPENL